MTVLDTAFVLDVMRADADAVRRMDALMEGYAPVGISAITVMQLHHGIPRADVPDEEARRIERALAGVPTYPVTHAVAARAGEIDGRLVAEGVRLDPADVLVGATALDRGEAVLTRNVRHFERVPGLDVETY